MRALDLFGGREAVITRMTERVVQGLKGLAAADIQLLEKRIGSLLHEKINLTAVASGTQRVDVRLFNHLVFLLNLSLWDVLGEPNYGTSKEYWHALMEDVGRPLAAVGSHPICLFRGPRLDEFVLSQALRELYDGE